MITIVPIVSFGSPQQPEVAFNQIPVPMAAGMRIHTSVFMMVRSTCLSPDCDRLSATTAGVPSQDEFFVSELIEAPWLGSLVALCRSRSAEESPILCLSFGDEPLPRALLPRQSVLVVTVQASH